MEIIQSFLQHFGHVLLESAPFLLLGFFAAGMIRVFVRPGFIAQHLGGSRYSSVVRAALYGIPLPLCSCGVISTGIGLSRQGANRGAVTSFMIATPETGVDSVAITYALLGPVIAAMRVVVAFGTALVAGFAVNTLDFAPTESTLKAQSCPINPSCACPSDPVIRHAFGERLRKGLHYGFIVLLPDLGKWLLIGFSVAALISTFVPADAMSSAGGTGLEAKLLVLLVSIPLYICATSSTPVAAAMIMQGMSVGTALVFLLAGPATNSATITMVRKYLGWKTTAIYLGTIIVLSIAAGVGADLVWPQLREGVVLAGATAPLPYALELGSAVLLVGFLGYSYLPRFTKKLRNYSAYIKDWNE